jgi:hypothetical protein
MLTSGGYEDQRAPIRKTEAGATIVVASPGLRRAYIRNRHQDLSAMIDRYDRIEATDEDPYHIRSYANWSYDEKRMIHIDP